jgi:hypothetical protein
MASPYEHIQVVNVGSNVAVRLREPAVYTVRVASTANISDLAAASSSVDGVTCVDGDVVLLKDQSTASQNGVYAFSGIASGVGVLTRVPPLASGWECFAGTGFYVESGTVNSGMKFLLSTTGAITLGTTSLSFARATPKFQAVNATLASGTITINSAITVATASEVIAYPIGALSGTTNLACLGELKASRVNGGPGTGTVVIQAYGDDGAIDADAAGAIRVLILTP